MVQRTSRAILLAYVIRFTGMQAVICTDEWRGDLQRAWVHHTVDHGHRVWASNDNGNDNGDGTREVHVDTCQGWRTTVHNVLHPFSGVHNKVSGCVCGNI